MTKQIISTDKAPQAIGPYSQAVRVGDMIYTSGMIPIIPETGELETGDIKAQAKQAIGNLIALLEAAGSGADKVIKTTVFIKDMNDFAAVNEVYSTFFKEDCPARSCVEVARLPKDVLIEIECVATV
ncbi:MAG: RidA family protein [Lachnospiraceae bacterium]|nr:RidA family protein [Lachnospiraceae bacterium]